MTTEESVLRLDDGRQIVIWHSRPQSEAPLRGTVLLAPGFCGRMYSLAATAAYLCANGFAVYRYDPLDHRGPSSGELADFTMSTGRFSMDQVLDWLARERGVESLGVIATSLSARIAYRVASERAKIRYLVTAVGVTDLRATLTRVFGVDHMASPPAELPPTVVFEDRHHIRTLGFATDAHERGWNPAATTRVELDRATLPIVAFIARDDDWVLEREVEEALDLANHPERRMCKLEGSGHNLAKNPRIAQAMLRELTGAVMALENCTSGEVQRAALPPSFPALEREPTFEMLTTQVIAERRRSTR
ncbi:hypothetical protein [Enhygromyxa salina]|uniref:hypothetical protein n=1 Tax=Enhygromyxa salina TaxID=215803 RepID=UPI0015E5B67C|nr:hypothetical protein [Enhygromyxa salina]